MFTLDLAGGDLWDEARQRFVTTEPKRLRLEHSLYAISRWEMRYEKPYLSWKNKLEGETLYYYIWCMCLDEDVTMDDILSVPPSDIERIVAYMGQKMTAMKMPKGGGRGSKTSESVYAVMVELGIPFECDHWNFNRLMALIEACKRLSGNGKKMSRAEILQRNTELNEKRRAALHSRG